MFPSGIGFKSIMLEEFHPKEKEFQNLLFDETLLKVGSEFIWLWVAIEPQNRQILVAVTVTRERNMLIAERFISSIVRIHGKHPVSTDRGTLYPQACRFLNLDHHIHSPLEKSLIERTMHSISRIEPNVLMTTFLAG